MKTRSSLVRRAAATGVAVLAAAALGACGADARLESSEVVRASVTSPRATQVTVTFDVSGDPNCRQYEGTDLREEAGTVTVRVTVRTTARDCPDDAVPAERTVTLSQPLGNRHLVDAVTGQPVEVTVAS